MNYKVVLRRIESVHDNLRTPEVTGTCSSLPTKNVDFIMVAPALTPGAAIRYVHTTPVTDVKLVAGKFLFKTANSTYELELVDEDAA